MSDEKTLPRGSKPRLKSAASVLYLNPEDKAMARKFMSKDLEPEAVDEWRKMIQAARAGVPYKEYMRKVGSSGGGTGDTEEEEEEEEEEELSDTDDEQKEQPPVDLPEDIKALRSTLDEKKIKEKKLLRKLRKNTLEKKKSGQLDDEVEDPQTAALKKQLEDVQRRNKMFEDLFKELLDQGRLPPTPQIEDLKRPLVVSRSEAQQRGGLPAGSQLNEPDIGPINLGSPEPMPKVPLPSRAAFAAKAADSVRLSSPESARERAESQRVELSRYIASHVSKGDMKAAVQLPETMNASQIAEWLAINVHVFFTDAKTVWFSVSAWCGRHSCPVMTAGPKVQYLWQDHGNSKYQKPTAVCASMYIDLLFTWVATLLNDEKVFVPAGSPYPKRFREQVASAVLRRLFRVYAHIYHHHFLDMKEKGDDHVKKLNLSFKHLVSFIKHWKLMASQEMLPLQQLITLLHGDQTMKKEYQQAMEEAALAFTLPRTFSKANAAKGFGVMSDDMFSSSDDDDISSDETGGTSSADSLRVRSPEQAIEDASQLIEQANMEQLQKDLQSKDERQRQLEEQNRALARQLTDMQNKEKGAGIRGQCAPVESCVIS